MRLRKVENFPVRGIISELDSSFKGQLQESQCKKYRKLWTMDCVKFAQGWEVLLLADPNDIHKNIMLEITSY